MMIPVRCFTCGTLVADKWEEFVKRKKAHEDPGEILDSLGLKRYCCRRTILSNMDTIDQLLPYHEALSRRHAEFASEEF